MNLETPSSVLDAMHTRQVVRTIQKSVGDLLATIWPGTPLDTTTKAAVVHSLDYMMKLLPLEEHTVTVWTADRVDTIRLRSMTRQGRNRPEYLTRMLGQHEGQELTAPYGYTRSLRIRKRNERRADAVLHTTLFAELYVKPMKGQRVVHVRANRADLTANGGKLPT